MTTTLVFGKIVAKNKYMSVHKGGNCRCVPLAEHIKLTQQTQLFFIVKKNLLIYMQSNKIHQVFF